VATTKAVSAFPVRRQDFEFGEVPRYWVNGDAFMTHVFNGMSALFPDGERFFVASVRAVRDAVNDPQLQKDISAFIGQEAMHAKEHEKFNRGAVENGYDLKALEGWTRKFLAVADLPGLSNKKVRLAATVALEHFTGILSAQLLRRDDIVESIDESMRNLWMWHCVEENEHKAVAFDTYKLVYGEGAVNYAIRMGTMLLATMLIMVAIHAFVAELLRQDGKLFSSKEWGNGLAQLWGRTGMFKQIIPEFFDYFKPGFHPWDHDTEFLLKRYRKRMGFQSH